MNRLIVNPGTPNAWAIELKPGVISLGRSEDNDFPIEHPSVSSSHCQIVITDTGATIKDLGSTGGTFVESTLVEEAVLQAGQTIHLGEVAMQFESDTPAVRPAVSVPPSAYAPEATIPMPPPVAPVSIGEALCKFHPRTRARFLCPQCRHTFCDFCVSTRPDGDSTRRFCRACGGECVPVQVPVQRVERPAGFFAQLPGAFTYPFRGSGVVLLVAGTVFFLVVSYVASIGAIGPYGVVVSAIVGVCLAGYLFSYAKRIVASSANGEADPPDWPDFSDWREDILMPFGQLVALLVLTFAPATILRWWQPGSETFASTVVLAATLLGALLAPMGMLALALFDTVAALNPLALVWSILRIPLHYLVAAAAFVLVVGAYQYLGDAVGSLIPVPVLPSLLNGFISLYLMTAGMRILGLLYLTEKDKLGWFSR
jgi:hypothetical protein